MKISAITRRGVLAVLFILLVGIFVWLLCIIFQPLKTHYQEPQYEGKKLTDWAEEVDQGAFFGHPPIPKNREQSELAIAAIRHIGTNAKPAVPMLVHILESEPNWPNKAFSPPKINSMVALSKIGPEAAQPAIPALLHILESKPEWPQDDHSALRNTALFTLSKIDPQAAKPFIPRLLHILESKSDWSGGYAPGQIFALVVLWRVDPGAAEPFLEKWKASQTNAPSANTFHPVRRSNLPLKQSEQPSTVQANSAPS